MELVLFGLLAVMLIFMVVNTRKRNKQMKADQEEKATKTVPGAKVLLQGGLYGTIVSFNPEDLDEPARVELAPGAVVEVHSQAVLRVIDPKFDEPTEDETEGDEIAEESDVIDADVTVSDEAPSRLDGDSGTK